MLLIKMLEYAALIAVFAIVYRHILAEQPVLNWWFVWGDRFENKWFYKPIWGCELCISGQIALWTYALNWLNYGYFSKFPSLCSFLLKVVPLYHFKHYSVAEGLIFICFTIGTTWALFKGFNRLQGN